MYYSQANIIEYNIILASGETIPEWGLVISHITKSISSGMMMLMRISCDMSAYNPECHMLLQDSMMDLPLTQPCYLTSDCSFINTDLKHIQVINSMNQDAFDNSLAWLTRFRGHKWLWHATPL